MSLLRRLQELVRRFTGNDLPPFAHAFAVCEASPTYSGKVPTMASIIEDMRILWGVPKYRTSKPKKVTRKFSYTRLLSPVENIVPCSSCGTYHQVDTICGNCYEKVREVTNEIKRKMMNYNPYKGEKPTEKVFVKFADDVLDEGVVKGKRVVELERERPSWFKKLL